MPRLLFASLAVLAALAFASPAAAGKRVALVIGNGAYAKVGALLNPTKDAAAVEEMLVAAGFDDVQRLIDLSGPAMRRALRNFSDLTRDADIALVFYAGHGIEVNGSNYLVPVDAVLERDIDVEDETVPLERVAQVLEQTKGLRLIILDACRDNPFAQSMKRTIGGRSVGRGLARVDVLSSETLIAYAAKAGSTAIDGDGSNSPYTTALIKHLTTPGLDVRLAFGRVRDDVMKSTRSRQEPFVYGSLGGAELPLVATATAAQPPVAQPLPPAAPKAPSLSSAASREWQDVKESTSVTVLEHYLQRYKDDAVYAELAKGRIESLKRPPLTAPTRTTIPRFTGYIENERLQEFMNRQELRGTYASGASWVMQISNNTFVLRGNGVAQRGSWSLRGAELLLVFGDGVRICRKIYIEGEVQHWEDCQKGRSGETVTQPRHTGTAN